MLLPLVALFKSGCSAVSGGLGGATTPGLGRAAFWGGVVCGLRFPRSVLSGVMGSAGFFSSAAPWTVSRLCAFEKDGYGMPLPLDLESMVELLCFLLSISGTIILTLRFARGVEEPDELSCSLSRSSSRA